MNARKSTVARSNKNKAAPPSRAKASRVSGPSKKVSARKAPEQNKPQASMPAKPASSVRKPSGSSSRKSAAKPILKAVPKTAPRASKASPKKAGTGTAKAGTTKAGKSPTAKVALRQGALVAAPPRAPVFAAQPLTPAQLAQRQERARQDASYDPGVDEGLDPGFFPSDEVLDEAEQAQFIQLKEQANISIRARELNRPEFHPDFDGENCVECGDPMPPARLALHRVRCVECQWFLENEAARRRRLMG